MDAATLNEETALYRWFDADGALLYVGISANLAVRTGAHAKRSPWARFASQSSVERFTTRGDALAAERAAIEVERPLFNRAHNDTAEARKRLTEYLVKHSPRTPAGTRLMDEYRKPQASDPLPVTRL